MTPLQELLDDPDVLKVILIRHDDQHKTGNYTVTVHPVQGARPYTVSNTHDETPEAAVEGALRYHRMPRDWFTRGVAESSSSSQE